MKSFVIVTLLAVWNCSLMFSGEVQTIAGVGTKGFSGDGGPAIAAHLNNPFGIGRGPDGMLYICDVDNDRIRRIDANGVISTYAGNGVRGYSGDGRLATEASLNQPYEVAWDKSGNLYFVEIGNHTVRRIDQKSGVISTIAGTGNPGFSGDGGRADLAMLNQPHSLAFDPNGLLYVCDILNHRVRKINIEHNTISTWSGTGAKKTSPDGTPLKDASLHGPRAIAFDRDVAWLALREGNALMKMDLRNQQIYRVAGNGKSGFSGNGGPALNAALAGPKGVSVDARGNVYLADTESHSIRMYDVKSNTLELIVGDGTKGYGAPGSDAKTCQLSRPHGVFVDQDGSIYIGDSENHCVRVLRVEK